MRRAYADGQKPQLPPGYVVITTQSLEDATRLCFIPGEIIPYRGGRAAVAIASSGGIIPLFMTPDEARAACWLHSRRRNWGAR